jgi:hypothetical protein
MKAYRSALGASKNTNTTLLWLRFVESGFNSAIKWLWHENYAPNALHNDSRIEHPPQLLTVIHVP